MAITAGKARPIPLQDVLYYWDVVLLGASAVLSPARRAPTEDPDPEYAQYFLRFVGSDNFYITRRVVNELLFPSREDPDKERVLRYGKRKPAQRAVVELVKKFEFSGKVINFDLGGKDSSGDVVYSPEGVTEREQRLYRDFLNRFVLSDKRGLTETNRELVVASAVLSHTRGIGATTSATRFDFGSVISMGYRPLEKYLIDRGTTAILSNDNSVLNGVGTLFGMGFPVLLQVYFRSGLDSFSTFNKRW